MSPSVIELRTQLLDELRQDLIGPHSETERLNDPPTIEYLTGILYPCETSLDEEEDDRLEIDEDGSEEATNTETIILSKTINPASLGLSFAVEKNVNCLEVEVSYGLYTKCGTRRSDGWQRQSFKRIVSINLSIANGQQELENRGFLQWIVRPGSGTRSISLFLVNRNVTPDPQTTPSAPDLDELCLFQPSLRVWSPDTTHPFAHREPVNTTPTDADLETYDLLYRDRYEFATGHGCAAEWNTIQGKNAGLLWTTLIPSYELPTTLPNDMPGLSMRKLGATNAKPADIVTLVQPLLDDYQLWIDERKKEASGLSSAKLRTTADINLAMCTEALQRMKQGLNLIQNNAQVFEAFRFANQAMFLQRSYGKQAQIYRQTGKRPAQPLWEGTWRPFQLAFILLNLPGIIDPTCNDRNLVDLLWFPTGGGKTEAYLGLIAFTLALRRLRGPKDGKESDGGVTVMMRYTLRLLTTQQFQRAAALICACEVTRRKNSTLWGKRPFQIGLWVGKGATPNDLQAAAEALERLASNGVVKEGNPRQLTSCPWCGEELTHRDYIILHTRTGNGRVRLLIVCPNTQCHFHIDTKPLRDRKLPLPDLDRSLPVVLVDEDIYHQCPSLLIATVDKFARLPWETKTMALFGQVDRFCSDHGYLTITENHSASHRGNTGNIFSCPTFLPPELIIQDELHLISGPLGTLAGLYEAAIDQLCTYTQKDGKVIRPKIIASTATIRRAEDQVNGLFARSVRLFPPSGLTVEDSFFAVARPLSQRAGRLYVGVCAPGRSVKTALVRTYAILLQVAGEQLAQYGPGVADAYTTLLGYFNSLRELGGALRLVEDDIVQRMRYLAARRQQAEREIKNETRELTSRTPAYKIPEILSQLEKPVGDPEALDVLLATNMISVGVDINRLGLMVVTGQPKTSAEYIQATSRVGRQAEAPGLVVTVFNWSRPRDTSHYERFRPYHEAIYRHVEATSVTPFAPRARDRALHAVLVALARLKHEPWTPNQLAGQFDSSHQIVKTITDEIINRVKLVDARSQTEVKDQLAALVLWWKSMAARHQTRLRYTQNYRKYDSTVQELLHPAEETRKGGSRSTLNSLRDVEGETQLFIIWD
jgi:hypothetical protein